MTALTNRQLTALERLAVEVAVTPPEKPSAFANHAYVSWSTVEEIRRECERSGIDWREIRRRASAIRQQRKELSDGS